MRSVLFIVLLLAFSIFINAIDVNAVEFSVNVFPFERTIKLNESAVFELEIAHNSSSEEVFEVYSNDVTWDVRTDSALRVLPRASFKTNLIVRPLNVNTGAYNLPLVFRRTGSNDQQKEVLYVEVASAVPEQAGYLPAVRSVATVEPGIDPRKGMTIRLSLENQNLRNLEKVDVKIRSAVVNKDYTTSLGPLEKKSLTFVAELDLRTPPQKDFLRISIIIPEAEKAFQFDLFPVSYEIVSYGGVVPSVSTESFFLKWIENVSLFNDANRELVHVYRIPAWFVKKWFISGTPKPESGSGELFWEIPFKPGSSEVIVVTYNYRPILWVLLVLAVFASAYYLFRSPLRVVKRVIVVGEDEISELKVVIELINRGRASVKHLRVMDLAPRLADVVHEPSGTILEPSKVSPHEQSGTIIRWDIDVMESKEHRILVYKLRTKLGVLGGLTLPVAAVKFKFNNQEREIVSNKPEIRFKKRSYEA